MGVLRSTQSLESEMREFKQEMMLLLKHHNYHQDAGNLWGGERKRERKRDQKPVAVGDDNVADEKKVCVTSGMSFLGFAIASRLLARGYTVRLLLDTQEDLEKVREMGMLNGYSDDDDDEETMTERGNNNKNNSSVWSGAVVVGDMMDVEKLVEAFEGCSCVFHTSAFTDPAGISGYSKHMAEIEARTAERVIDACVRSQSVRKCVFTSSLLACVWRKDSPHNERHPTVVNENCWTNEGFCRDRKLWFALGKTMAEKAAWRAARGSDVKLVTLCPGLVTGPGFRRRNATPSIAYLKGSQEMLRDGLLATIDVSKLADIHVRVYEAMGRTACGRYICFDHIVQRAEDVAELERQLRIPNRIASIIQESDQLPTLFELSKSKVSRLMSSSRRCLQETYSIL